MTAATSRLSTNPRVRAWLPAVLLAAIVALTYARMFGNEPILDDPWVTVHNPYVQSIAGLPTLLSKDVWSGTASGEQSSLYRPVFMTSFLVNRLILGNSKQSYHAGNLVMHVATTLLLFRLLLQLLRKRTSLAFLGALWFGVTPIESEAVAWISARCDPLGASFALAALLAQRRRGPWAAGLVVLFATAALFTKESFVLVPLIVLVDDTIVLRHPLRTEAWKYGGLALGAASYFVCRAMIGVPSVTIVTGTPPLVVARSFLSLVADYVARLFVPYGLDPSKPYVPLPVWPSLAVAAALIGAAVGLWTWQRREPEDARPRVAILGCAWFLSSLGPVSLVGPNLLFLGDRYAYFPTIGLCVAIVACLDAALDRISQRAHGPRLAVAVLAAFALGIAAQGIRTVRRLPEWHDEESLFRAALRDTPENFQALYWLGQRRALTGRFAEAEPLLRQSIAIEPRAFRSHNALCFVLLNEGSLSEADRECRTTVSLPGGDADPRAWVNLASVYVRERRWQDALDCASQAVAIKNRYAEAHYLRAVSLANLGRTPEAATEIGATLAIDPAHPGAASLAGQMRARGLTP